MTFTLFKDKEEISSLKCSHEKNGLNCTPTHIVFIPQNTQHESISFILTNSSKGIYRCEGAVIFPPPYKPVPSEVSILTLVEGKYSEDVLMFKGMWIIWAHTVQFAEYFANMLLPGHQCQKNKDNEDNQGSSSSENPCNEFVWIWIMVVVLLFIYSTAVTIMAFVIWVRYSSNTLAHSRF